MLGQVLGVLRVGAEGIDALCWAVGAHLQSVSLEVGEPLAAADASIPRE
jgi:hypothetical protein